MIVWPDMKRLPRGVLLARALIAILPWLLVAWTGSAPAQTRAMEPLDRTVCRLIDSAARAHRLPAEFLTRLIWRESSFRAGAVSPAGAQGIAQFMPGTAQERGLADPFDPEQAIPKAAHLLADLRRRFGNLGIAAAAYNAGPGRVSEWLRGEGGLPAETRAYVRFITSRPVEAWTGSESEAAAAAEEADQTAKPVASRSCLAAVADLRRGRPGEPLEDGFAPLAPWGVQLAGNFSKAIALASFERARQRYAGVIGNIRPMIIGRILRSRGTKKFYQVRLPAPTRQAANALCGRIRAVGGICLALPS
ncbi:MAG: lytic transglycosylase domain-containing protein [Alphaproteobacteria bacterium]